MTTLNEYFSDQQIIGALCRARVKLARQRHDAAYTRRLTGRHLQPKDDDELSRLLPPRKAWARFRPNFRRGTTNVDLISLQRATLLLRNSSPAPVWVARLNAFIARISQRIQDHAFAFTVPTVRWELKDAHKYRAIAMFNLEDNVICGLTAQYLKNFIDPAFEPSSYAFRAVNNEGKMPTHHIAFDRIYDIRRAAGPKKQLYVAECDIRGFYDSVDHGVAWNSLLRVIASREQMEPRRNFGPRAAIIFKAYLDCYSFPKNVLGEAAARLKEEQDPEGRFPWPAEALAEFHNDPLHARIGVPQGGAISCLIANLVLDLADKRTAKIKHPGLNYLRYCDDMVLIARTKRECKGAFTEYLKALGELKLPYHPPKTIRKYGREEFWGDGMKSKAPYCWSAKRRPSYVPWVQFVGYQVRYDGLVRPKPKAVKKHRDALRETVDTVKRALLGTRQAVPVEGGGTDERLPFVLAGRSQAESSVEAKLVSMSVGRVDPERPKYRPLPMCWANGFKALHGKPMVPTFLKQLDRERERQVRRFKRAQVRYGRGRPSRKGTVGGVTRSWHPPRGYLFSYHAQFQNVGGRKLIENP